MSSSPDAYPHFRLNFEQQGKRAKDVLKAARDGDAAALARLGSAAADPAPLTLASAQQVIAREMRFSNWAELKRHTASMSREREAMRGGGKVDADLPTLHVRCGSDIRAALQEAGFVGDFYEHSYPYLIGPVRDGGAGCLEERARFLVDAYGDRREPPLLYASVLEGLQRAEQQLQESARYERVVIWSEGDAYDQLVLLRLLGHYATHQRPRHLDLINLADFPGSQRFLGLGQLPPEALRLLWASRRTAGAAQLRLGLGAWRALADSDPRELASLCRTGTPELPLLAPALHRHLRELPSLASGLSLTEEMALALLAEEPRSLNQLFVRLTHDLDPLPGQGDLQVRDRVLGMEVPARRVFVRRPGVDREGRSRPPWTDVLEITDLGRAVLRGEVDFRSLAPRPRWVGGVRVGGDSPDWRWDESRRDARLRGT